MMNTSHAFAVVMPLLSVIAAGPVSGQDSTLSIILVAGQSNALNWHADAASLERSAADSTILFYYHTGIPPSKSPSDPFNATSDSQWTTLRYQTQQPYKLYHEDFFGPEMTLARELSHVLPRLAVIKCVYAGSTLATDWKKGIGAGDQLYELMMSQVQIARAILDQEGMPYRFEGFFWMQGESDAANAGTASAYELNLTQFLDDVRTDLDAPGLRCVLGRINADLPSPYMYTSVVRGAQMNVADSDPAVSWVDLDDLPVDADNVHLLAEGVKVLGVRMAQSWTALSTRIGRSGSPTTPAHTRLCNFPNPFNATTTISFQLTFPSFVTLTVFDMLGNEVEVLLAEDMAAGEYTSMWSPAGHPSGLYFCRLRAGSGAQTRKIVFLK